MELQQENFKEEGYQGRKNGSKGLLTLETKDNPWNVCLCYLPTGHQFEPTVSPLQRIVHFWVCIF